MTGPDHALPRLVISGAGGVIGRHLLHHASGAYRSTVLTRGGTRPEGVTALTWNPRAVAERDERGLDDVAAALDGAHAIVNLAGASLADGRLGPRHVERLRSSRVEATTTLVQAARRCVVPPAAWFQASAVGIFGDAGERELDDDAPADPRSPLAAVLTAWEAAAAPAAAITRLVVGRIGMVLARDAKAWRLLLRPVRLFVGGPLGSGRQWWSWIEAGDLSRAILWLLEREDAEGAYNLVGEPVRQIDLLRAAAWRLGRPTAFPVPALLLRIAVGGLADTTLLASQRVVPERLLDEGFEFEVGTIDAAVARLLG